MIGHDNASLLFQLSVLVIGTLALYYLAANDSELAPWLEALWRDGQHGQLAKSFGPG